MKPLSGVRIVTLERFGAGPYGTMFLADLGAEVIKVEDAATGGDPSRQVGPALGDDSQYFQTWNANKLSVSLDIKSPEGRKVLERLVATADAVVNNLRGDQPGRLRIDYAGLKDINPRIVCLSISGYGRDNQRSTWPGYDYLMQAEAGLMELTGEPDGPPCRSGASMIDYMTGLTGMVGLLSCLHRARATGAGCDVDVSLFDVALHQLGYTATWYLNEQVSSTRQPRGAHLALTPVQTFPTADSWIYIMCMTEKFFVNLVAAIGRPELGKDPRFCDLPARLKNRGELTSILDAELRRKTTTDWIAALSGLVPVAPILGLGEALDAPFISEVQMISAVPHPSRPNFRMLANPLRLNGQRLEQTAAPLLGEHNARFVS